MAPSNDDETNLGKGRKSENDRKIAGAGAGAEEGKPRQRRSDNNHDIGNGNGSQQQPKRRRLCNKPRSRCIIPEARVIQGYDEYAYISDHEEDESEREYLPRPVRRRVEVVRVTSRHQIPQPQEEVKNDGFFLFKLKAANDDGLRHGARARCFCFNCW